MKLFQRHASFQSSSDWDYWRSFKGTHLKALEDWWVFYVERGWPVAAIYSQGDDKYIIAIRLSGEIGGVWLEKGVETADGLRDKYKYERVDGAAREPFWSMEYLGKAMRRTEDTFTVDLSA